MNKYILISKTVDNNDCFNLLYAPIISYNKNGKSGVFISQNNRMSSSVSKEEFDSSVLGQIKSLECKFI